MSVGDIETGKHQIICANCRQDNMRKLYVHSFVKSHVHYCMRCWTCGYEAILKLSAKRNL